MDERSIALLEFPLVRARLAEATSFPPSRRLAEALEPSDDPVIVARGLDETDQARALLTERPGRRDRRRARHRAGDRAGGPRRPPGAGPVPRARRDARCDRAAGDRARRRATAAPARPRGATCTRCPRCAARSRAASTRSGSCSTRPRRGSAACAAAVRVAYDRLRRRLDALVGAELGSALQEPIVTLRNGRYVVPVKAEARARVKGIVHDASGSGQTLFIEPLVVVELGNAWREAQVAEAEEVARILDELSAFVAANGPAAARDARRARALRLLGRQGEPRRRDGRRPRRDRRDRAETVVLLSARHPGPDRPGRADRHPARRRLPGARRDRPEHRRQDRHAADARPAQPDAPGRAAHPAAAGQPAAGLARRLRRHRRRAVDRAVALDVLRAPALDHPDRADGRARARSSCSTSSARGPTRPRAPRWRRRSSTTSSGPARWSRRRPTTPSSRPTPTRPPGARNAVGRVRPRDAEPDVPAVDRPARRQPGVRDRRAARPARDDRRRRALAAVRVAALVRGDARRDQGDRGRDERGARPGPGRRAAGGGGAARRPTRSGVGLGASATRRSGRPATRRTGSSARCATRSATRAGRSSARPSRRRASTRRWNAPRRPRRGLPASEGPVEPPPPDRAAALAGRRAGPEPVRRLGGPDRGARAGRPAGDPRGGRDARVTVDVDDLVPGAGRADRVGPGRRRARGHVQRGRAPARPSADRSPRRSTCAAPGWTRRSTRSARYLDDAALAGSRQGHDHPRPRDGGPARRRAAPGRGPPAACSSVRPGERGEGGDGATIVELVSRRALGLRGRRAACRRLRRHGDGAGRARASGSHGRRRRRRRERAQLRRRERRAPRPAERAKPAVVEVGRPGALRGPPDAGAAGRARRPVAVGLLPGGEVRRRPRRCRRSPRSPSARRSRRARAGRSPCRSGA